MRSFINIFYYLSLHVKSNVITIAFAQPAHKLSMDNIK